MKHALCKRYMQECAFFSISVDTALFRCEDFMSCVVRFTFENNALELPLFISSCRVASGNDMARFIFDKLIERNAHFDKLVSISTDGAANMIGRFNGMTNQFRLLVEQYCRDHQSQSHLIHSIWCFAHRLHLVTKAFLSAKPINVVLNFADWFANKRRQFSYKQFLTVNQPNDDVKAIPQPSDTRWLFYRDVVKAIISQARCVESFVSRESDFTSFWKSVRREEAKFGRSIDRDFSFEDPYIKATFSFCSYILELLGNVNVLFQERLCTVTRLWDVVLSLKNKILSLIFEANGDGHIGIDCLNGLKKDESVEFQNLLRLLLHSLDMRFPCPSHSLEMRYRHLSEPNIVSLQNYNLVQEPHCSVLPLIDFMVFPQNAIHSNILPSVCQDKMRVEVLMMIEETAIHMERIDCVKKERQNSLRDNWV